MRQGRLPHVAIAVAVGLIYLAGGLEPIERQLMDLRFRLLRRSPEAPVTIVAIDPRSLGLLDVWPWPRGYYATVLERLHGAGAARVAFDLDLSSRSEAQEDEEFARALAGADPPVILPVFERWQSGPGGEADLLGAGPLPSFRAHAALASINIRPDGDGLTRRYWPSGATSASAIPSMAALLHGDGPAGDRPGRAGAVSAGPFHIDFGLDLARIPTVSFVDVLTGSFDATAVAGRSVIVGATSVELGDQVAVPIHVSIPGPVLQALAFACLHSGRALHRVPAAAGAMAALLIGAMLGPRLQSAPWRRGLRRLLAATASLLVLAIAAHQWGAVLVDVSPMALVLACSYALGLVTRIDQQGLSLIAQAARVRGTETRMRHVVHHSFDAIITVSDRGKIETFNPAAEAMFDRRVGETIGRPVEILIPAGLGAGTSVEATPGGPPREVTALRRGGGDFPAELSLTSFEHEGRSLLVVFLRDITLRRAQQNALEHQATHDALTELPNRFMLGRRAAGCLESSRRDGGPAAFLILDLDRFKEINDALGHPMGDRLLREIATRLREALEPGDTIARLGGDEFAVILPGADFGRARRVAGTLAGALRPPFTIDGLRLQVDTSIGIALYPDHGDDPSALIQRADVAMYLAKRTRNAVAVYDPQQDLSSVRHLALRGELSEAIERDQLLLHYQPKISGLTGAIEGVEALVRWRHPRHGLLPPVEFIPVAEGTGLIRPLTAWVLETALRQCAAWDRRGLSLNVAVNCSARNLLEEDLTETIAGRLESSGLSAERLVLEITETALIEDPIRSLSVLELLAARGLSISIDDFGTGYSSLAHLKRLAASELKIDGSFVTRMDQNEADAVIVRSTIDLAHNLGLKAVAEGVESDVVWRTLRDMGCDQGQGFYLGRPMTAEALERYARASLDAVPVAVAARG